jgi:outer membrane protein assembly factor BamD
MNRWFFRGLLTLLAVVLFPYRSPAPLIYTPGEGWTYESVGGSSAWRKNRAKDQLKVAQDAFDSKNYSLARKAAQRVVKTWPLSDYAPQSEYLVARCHEATGNDEKAFKFYQVLIQKYPKTPLYDDILRREFDICNRFLNGQRFLLWNMIPTYRSMDKTAGLYEKLINNGPYSDVAPLAQLNIGAAREKQTRFLNDKEPYVLAAKAYEHAADIYHDKPKIASEALYREGLAYQKQARTAEYDQSTAGQAITAFQEFMTLYPEDSRIGEGEKIISQLKTEQARGNFQIASFYEKRRHWQGALIYYNEVLLQDPKSTYATTALQKITEIKKMASVK